jgi:hypothetical protein
MTSKSRKKAKRAPARNLGLRPLPHDELSLPKFDGLRICIPDTPHERAGDISKWVEDFGFPFQLQTINGTPCYVSQCQVRVFLDKNWVRIEFHGRYFSLFSSPSEAMDFIYNAVEAVAARCQREPHITMVAVNRDFRDIAVDQILPLPPGFLPTDKDPIYWTFLKGRSPRNSWGEVWHKTADGVIRIYDRVKAILDAEGSVGPEWFQAQLDWLEKNNICVSSSDSKLTRMEIEVRTKESCASLTQLFRQRKLTAIDVLHCWAKKRSIYVAPKRANTCVSVKTKRNYWDNSRFREAFLINNCGEKRSGAGPLLRLYEQRVNLKRRLDLLVSAAHQGGVDLPTLLGSLIDSFDDGFAARGRFLAEKCASELALLAARPEASATGTRPLGDPGICNHPGISPARQEKIEGLTQELATSPTSSDVIVSLGSELAAGLQDMHRWRIYQYQNQTANKCPTGISKEAWEWIHKAFGWNDISSEYTVKKEVDVFFSSQQLASNETNSENDKVMDSGIKAEIRQAIFGFFGHPDDVIQEIVPQLSLDDPDIELGKRLLRRINEIKKTKRRGTRQI